MRDSTLLPHETQNICRIWSGQSGNCDNSRETLDTIVIHTMVGTTDGSTAHFKTANSSAHYGISYDGKITLWVPENMTAYHAGVYSVNQKSIGIEHEDFAKPNDVRPDSLYESSIKLVADICKYYGIPCDRDHVKKHCEISATACPGTLDIDRIVKGANQLLTPVVEEEALVSHMLKPSVFQALVIKSTNYDEIWKSLGLDESLKAKEGSYKMVIEMVNQKITEARMTSSTSQDTALQNPPAEEVAETQAKSVWEKDIFEMMKNFFSTLGGKKTA
jgi:hypothetical protein